MPRRTKTYIGPGKALVDGGRWDVVGEENGQPIYDITVDALTLDIGGIQNRVAGHIQNFNELAQLESRGQFVRDLADECASALTMRLDYLTRGARTKPDEWTTQILLRGVASVLERHGLQAAISEYKTSVGEKRQSLYLRLAPGLIKLVGLQAPNDIKGLCLRAKRIKHTH